MAADPFPHADIEFLIYRQPVGVRKCDGGKPCTRCTRAKISCIYQKPPPDPITQKLAQIEEQMLSLTSRVQRSPSTVSNTSSGAVAQSHTKPQPASQVQQQQQQQPLQQQIHITPTFPLASEAISPGSSHNSHSDPQSFSFNSQISNFPPSASISNSSVFGASSQQVGNGPSSYKKKQGDFEVNGEGAGDIIFRGIITYEEAVVYFQAFFQGCHKFVPVFDAEYDTFSSVRARSSMLFTTICSIGCRAENGPTSSQYQVLSNATKGPMCDVILGTAPTTIETVQALLVNSCYSEKGWILTSLATRMALDLDLPKAYRDLSTRILEARSRNLDGSMDANAAEREVERSLFRQARTWFGTFILDHIFSIDCGKKPGIQAKDGMRRCRVLLEHPSVSFVDIRLLAQVELNSIRALAHERLSQADLSNQEICDIIQGTRVDISLWLSDWLGIVDRATSDENERSRLKVPLRIQSDWAEMTMLCKGLQGMGIDNVAIMTDEQRNFIHLAKNSAQRHLTTMISDSESYLATFRYGMDFVWAKCAFSVLLLLKLARILPEATNMTQVIADVRILLDELSRARSSHNIYFRILCLSLEKCERALSEDNAQTTAEDQAAAVFSGPYEADADFQSYVPKEFILEWNFPGLTLCWIPLDFQDMFIDFGTGF